MKIINVTITEFAGLSELSLDFCDGLNVVEGLNESGKSSVNAFIKFMLYGLDNSKCFDSPLTERKYYTSWKSGIAQGMMTVEYEGRIYRIERKGIMGATYRDVCNIFDITTGEKMFRGREPGEIFLGIAAPIYESTCCVRQRELAEVDGKGVNDAIQNMLISADRNINLDRAKKKLLDVRRSLLLQRGDGGRIYELQNEVDALRVRLEKAKRANSELRVRRESAETKRKLVEKLRKDLNDADAKVRAFDEYQTVRKFDELNRLKEKTAALKLEISALEEDISNGGYIPDRDYYAALAGFESRLPSYEMIYEKARLAYVSAKEAPLPDEDKCAAYEKIAAAGGKDRICAVFGSHIRKQKAFTVLGMILAILGVLSAAAGVVLGAMLSPILFAVAGGGALLTALGIIFFCLAGKAKKHAASYLLGIGYRFAPGGSKKGKSKIKNPDIYALKAYISECMAESSRLEARGRAIDAARSFMNDKCREAEEQLGDAVDMLSVFCDAPSPAVENYEEIMNLLDLNAQKILEFCGKRDRLASQLEINQKDAARIAESLRGYDEKLLRGRVTPEVIESFGGETEVAIKLRRDYISQQIIGCDASRAEAERRLIELEASSEDPFAIAEELEEKEAKLSSLRTSLEAILLAYDTIDVAGNNLRNSVTPKLCSGASRRMAELTSGKYSGLSVDGSAKLSVTTDMTRDISVLSCGTRDAAYLSLRFAMIDMLFGENKPCVTIDEGLSQFDDIRARSMLAVLTSYCDGGGQCILFTCHSREGAMLSDMSTRYRKLEM